MLKLPPNIKPLLYDKSRVLSRKDYLTFKHSTTRKTVPGTEEVQGIHEVFESLLRVEKLCGWIPDENWNKQHNTQALTQTKPSWNSICLTKNCGVHLEITECIMGLQVPALLGNLKSQIRRIQIF